MKVVAVVQARTGSSRFPGKVLAQLGGQSMVQLIAKRLERAESLNSIWFAIPDSKEDHDLEKHLLGLVQNVFREDWWMLKRGSSILAIFSLRMYLFDSQRIAGDFIEFVIESSKSNPQGHGRSVSSDHKFRERLLIPR